MRAALLGLIASLLLPAAGLAFAAGCSSPGTTPSPAVPVSGTDTMGTMALPSTTGAGNASLEGRIMYNGTPPAGSVLVALMDVSGRTVTEAYAQHTFTLGGLAPGSYRLAVYALQTGYISQWYGRMPVQTHPATDSTVLQIGPTKTQVEFTLQPGRSIQGRITWSGAEREGGWAWAYDPSGNDTLHSAGFYKSDPVYLIVGLVPGRYKIGATAYNPQDGPKVWYESSASFAGGRLVDVSNNDATGIDIDLGTLAPTTTAEPVSTTIP